MFQGKSDEALESHLVDLRAQNAELISSGNFASSDQMQSALSAALRLASLLSSNQSEDTIQHAMAVLDSVNKKLYGMIDQTLNAGPTKSSQGEVQSTAISKSLDSVRGYGDDDDDEYQSPQFSFGTGSELDRQQSAVKRLSPTRSSGLGVSSQQPSAGPTKRFHFGL